MTIIFTDWKLVKKKKKLEKIEEFLHEG